jgi:hypothetical protein
VESLRALEMEFMKVNNYWIWLSSQEKDSRTVVKKNILSHHQDFDGPLSDDDSAR